MTNPHEEHGDVQNFETDENTGLQAYTYADRVKDRLETLGLSHSNEKPILADAHKGIFPGLKPGMEFDGRLPTVIRILTLDQLSALYTLFSNWFAYLRFQTNMIAVERSEAKRKKEFLWSRIRKQHKVKDPETGRMRTDQVVSDLARIDYRYLVADAQYEELNVLYNCMNAMVEVTEQDMQVISREVTINQIELEKKNAGLSTGSRISGRAWMGGKDGANTTKPTTGVGTPARSGRVRVPVKHPR